MLRGIFSAPLAVALSVAGATMCLTAAPVAAAGDGDCDTILPAADRLENVFNLVSPAGTPPYLATQVRNALAPLHGLRTPVAVDLRIRSDMLASQIDSSDPRRSERRRARSSSLNRPSGLR
jgi:hypothetical protein